MSGIFYTREPGADGQILSGEGVAPGVGLDQLLERDRPPLRAALEIGSAVADILCIAAEDKHVHGDIRPAHVKVDELGAVSIEGYGIVRRVTRAPEGRPDQPPADIYGLGLVMHASLSSEGLGNLPNDADGHDDAVVERVLGMDFSAVSTKRWLSEVREFLCKILAFDPRERPPALDAANVLASVAGQCPGDDIAVWAKRAHLRLAGGRPPARQVEENLAGPVALSGYFKKGDVQKESARKAPSSKGESTAMWSREKLAAMFAEEDDEDAAEARPAPREPSKARPRGEDLAPARPVAPAMPAAPPRQAPAPPPPVAAPVAAATIAPPFKAAETWTSSVPPRSEPPARAPEPPRAPARPQVVQPQSIQAGKASRIEDDEQPKQGSNTLMIVGGVAVVLVVLCAGFGLLGGGGYFFMNQTPSAGTSGATTTPSETLAAPAEKPSDTLVGATPTPAATPAAATPAAATPPAATPPAATPAPASSSTASSTPSAASTRPASTSKPTSTTSAATKPAATPATTTTATAAPTSTATSTTTYPVKFSAPGREGKVRCGDGQTVEFTGATTLNFSGTVTCLVQIGQGRGAVQVSRSSTVSCSEDVGKVSCTGGS